MLTAQMNIDDLPEVDELYHYGVKGMKWGKHLFKNGKKIDEETVIPEQFIEETVIPEQFIEETVLPEHKITEKIIPEMKITELFTTGKNALSKGKSFLSKLFSRFKHLDETDYLEHYGVSGQKWGVQNGPPYPLNKEAKSDLNKISKATDKYISIEKKIRKLLDEHSKKTKDLNNLEKKEYFRTEESRKFWEEVINPLVKEQEQYKKTLIDAGVNLSKLNEKIEHSDYLAHHGILGQKWGDQNGPPYPLGSGQKSYSEKKMAKMDKKWIRKNDKKIRKYAKKSTEDELRAYERELRKQMPKYNKNGKINSNFATAYSKKMAELYNEAIGDLAVSSGSGSGKVVKFVAARGQMDVFTALADYGYNMSNVKNGVYGSGRIGYKKESVGVDYGDRK